MADPSERGLDETKSKVGRLISEYELGELGGEVEQYWAGARDEQYSLRQLADYINRRILKAVMKGAEIHPTDREVEHLYELITDDDVDPVTRTHATRRLDRRGIDIGQVEDDFVSHQAVHTYLTEYRGVSQSRSTGNQREKTAETVQRLQSRTAAVVESHLGRIRNTDQLDIEDPAVIVHIRVMCETCGAVCSFDEALSAPACDCT